MTKNLFEMSSARWTEQETIGLAEVRSRLSDTLNHAPQYVEVVGDRRILRFLRGHEFDIDKTCEMLEKFIVWRREYGVDDIRRDIAERGINHPRLFPAADKILPLVPQIVINTAIRDRSGAPLCVEQYNFSPSNVLSQISLAEYVRFTIYCLEYKSMILEVPYGIAMIAILIE